MRIKKWAVMALFCGIFLTGCSKQTASKEASNSSNKSSQSSKSSVKKTSKASSSSAKAVKLDAAKTDAAERRQLDYCSTVLTALAENGLICFKQGRMAL